jgi:hypothetical protein
VSINATSLYHPLELVRGVAAAGRLDDQLDVLADGTADGGGGAAAEGARRRGGELLLALGAGAVRSVGPMRTTKQLPPRLRNQP